MDENEVIKGCLKHHPESQKQLYEYFYFKMFNLCLRYAKNNDEAKEMVHEGFLTIFHEIKNQKPNESLEQWVKSTMINSCIAFLKRNKENMIVSTVYANKPSTNSNSSEEHDFTDEEIMNNASKEILLKAIQELAPAYRKVYNLYVIDSYNHKMIAEILNIGEETSEQTLNKAHFYLRKNIKQLMREY